MNNWSDRALLESYSKQGEEQAFRELAIRYQALIHGVAYRICGNQADAQEVLQQVLIVLSRRAGELGKINHLGVWLHRAAVLEARKAVAKRGSLRRRETMAYETEKLKAEGLTLAAKLGDELDESLAALREKDREVITMHYLEGLTFQSIARQLGISPEACQKRSVRALDKLSALLKKRGVAVGVSALGGALVTLRESSSGVPLGVLKSITQRAIAEGGKSSTALGTAFFSMKTGLILSVTGGLLAVVCWRHVQESGGPDSFVPASVYEPPVERVSAECPFREKAELTLEAVQAAISHYDALDEADLKVEAQLSALMFALSQEMLQPVLESLLVVENKERFRPVVMALYARWAELDPYVALEAVDGLDDAFYYQGRRGVMVTWLNSDQNTALQQMLREKRKDDLDFLKEYIRFRGEIDPEEAARAVDTVAEDWLEADKSLFPMLADIWVRTDPEGVGIWVASHHDTQAADKLLYRLCEKAARIHNGAGVIVADMLSTPEGRARARRHAIHWWGIDAGGISLRADAHEKRNISSGYPGDWTDNDLRAFISGALVNFSTDLPQMYEHASSDHELNQVRLGVLTGARDTWADEGRKAAEALPASIMQDGGVKVHFRNFIGGWHDRDAKAARQWLAAQPQDAKTDFMWSVIGTEGAP